MPRIAVIQPQEATGQLAEAYHEITRSRGKLAEVHKIQSLNPATIISHMQLYMDIMYGASPLSRAQREMLGVMVSVQNQCRYCVAHHREALLKFWRSEGRIDELIVKKTEPGLSPMEQLLVRLAIELTAAPEGPSIASLIEALRTEGASDRLILDATLVIAYFNFVNRIVLALDVALEDDGGKGYNYEETSGN